MNVKISFLGILLFSVFASSELLSQEGESDKVYEFVEEMPYLESCDSLSEDLWDKVQCSNQAFSHFIGKNIILDSVDISDHRCCTFFASFIIDTLGTIGQVEVIRSVNDTFDKRAIKLLKSSPRWVPGKQNGKKVKVRQVIPLRVTPSRK